MPFLVGSSVTEERVEGGAEARVEALQAWTKLPSARRSEDLCAGLRGTESKHVEDGILYRQNAQLGHVLVT